MDKNKIAEFIETFDEISLYRQRNRISHHPTFIGVGAGRCGTSSLYDYFDLHPGIHMSPVKEINYFGFRDKESNPYGMTFNEYLSYFLGAGERQVIGEISPAYLSLPNAIPHMKKYLSDLRIIITLRDPIARMVSQYKYHFDKHQMPNINVYLRDGLKAYTEKTENEYRFNWFHPVKNITQSMYYESIKRIYSHYPKEKVTIIKFDQIKNNSTQVLEQLCNFLQVEYEAIELKKLNRSQPKVELDTQIEEDIMEQLLKLYATDLKQTEALSGIELTQWTKSYR